MSDRTKIMVDNQLRKRGIIDTAVLNAMSIVPRHRFVNSIYRSVAYTDNPLPIGHGQTISQPYVVALMTQLLQVDHKHKVLEIGTGCGYQTAILSILSKKVISFEVLSSLSTKSRKRLTSLDTIMLIFIVVMEKMACQKKLHMIVFWLVRHRKLYQNY